MNFISQFLQRNWQTLSLQKFGSAEKLVTVLRTPRFYASGHIIIFVLTENNSEPILIVKVPRLPGDNGRLQREAENLRIIQDFRPDGFESIPKVIAFEDWQNERLLVETALRGQVMKPAVVRRQTEACTKAGLQWLIELHEATTSDRADTPDWFERLVEPSLEMLTRFLPSAGQTRTMIERTRELIEPFKQAELRLVFEHGDLSAPNILFTGNHQIGVVDWELAEPKGLPCTDLFFFLTYIAFALERARKTRQHVAAFQKAFFRENAWSVSYLEQYRQKMNIPEELMKPLFVICWCRYVAGLITRLNSGHSTEKFAKETENWLKVNRYYILWKYTLDHFKQLNLCGN